MVLRLVVPDKWVERIDQLAVDQGKTQLEVISELISETVNDMPQAIPDKQIRVRKPKILRVMVPEKLGKRITRLAEAKEMSSSEFIFDVLTIAMKPQSKAT